MLGGNKIVPPARITKKKRARFYDKRRTASKIYVKKDDWCSPLAVLCWSSLKSLLLLHGTFLFKKNILLNANFVITCRFSFFICAFILTEKRANVVYPHNLWRICQRLAQLSNQYSRNRSPCSSQAGHVLLKMSCKLSNFLALLKQLGRLREVVPLRKKSPHNSNQR